MPKRATMGGRLQELRQAAGMSQSQLARAANVPIGTLRNWEQDRRTPLFDTAARVARSLGVSLDELYEEPAAKRRRARGKVPALPAKRQSTNRPRARG